MNKQFIGLILLLSSIIITNQYSGVRCTCSQIQSQGDCVARRDNQCTWDNNKNKCQIQNSPPSPISTITSPYSLYCNEFEIDICRTIKGCLLFEGKCKFFTGCTPYSYKSDSECQAISNQCISDGTHCVEIDNCNTYQNIQACRRNTQGQQCYWEAENNQCLDADTCSKLSKAYQNDKQCRQQIITCTVDPNGGCIESGLTCSDQKQEEQCVWNRDRTIRCYWNGSSCIDKICENAPLTLTTNYKCDSFLKGCITKSGGGCVQNGDCSAADTEQACQKDLSNIDCVWDGSCIKKTCDTADKTIITNEACEKYLPGNNCITKKGGGCIINTTCQLITLKAACQKNQSGQDCFWVDNQCKVRTCENAPLSNNDHIFCLAYSTTCTVNSKRAGCVEKTCENISIQNVCVKDVWNNQCVWQGQCYRKQCVFAPLTFRTHSDCQGYLPSCTLSNTGSGCTIIPLICQAITIEAACYFTANGQQCGWNGFQCINKSCSTAPKSFTTTKECNQYLYNCVANNPIQGVVSGCQDLPASCIDRQSTQNCEITRVGFPICIWNLQISSCVEKSCSTANIPASTGTLFPGSYTFSACQNYLESCSKIVQFGTCYVISKPCISNNNEDGCMVKPSSCTSLIKSNCKLESKENGDCYWNGISCVDRVCSNIIKTTHNECYNSFDQCTVNNEGSQCQLLARYCTEYQTLENCKFNSDKQKCIWTGLNCRDATCADAPDNSSYNTDEECLNYSTPQETCTVIYKVQSLGCVWKLSNCTEYMAQGQCHKTIDNLTQNDDCIWIIDKCYSLSTFETGPCSKYQGTQAMCQAYKLGCTNNIDAISKSNCILDCTLKKGANLAFQDCQSLDTTCSVRKDGTSCIILQKTCQDYGTTSANCFKASSGFCAMNQNSTPTCQAINQASECQFVSNLSGLDHNKCQQYNPSCTSLNNGIGCQEYKTICSNYAGNTNNCTISQQGKCYLKGTNCLRFQICTRITGTGLNDTKCAAYHQDCTSNREGTACQEQKNTCDLYLTQSSCTISKAIPTSNQCVWTDNTCIAVTIISTQCGYISGQNLEDTQCSSYNIGCIANVTGTFCQEKKATCNLYINQDNCVLSTAGKCYWNDAAVPPVCISIKTISTDCQLVKGTGLNDTKCSTYHQDCTSISDGTACQEQKNTCDLYLTQSSCTISKASPTANLCIWNSTVTPSKCITIITISTQCAYISGQNLDDSQCSSYNVGCIANVTGTFCQEKKATCNLYINQDNCVLSTAGKCYWNDAAVPPVCISIKTISTDCQLVKGTGLNDTKCSTYHQDCTSISDGTACQEQKNTCDLYLTQSSCTISKASPTANQCIWNSTVTPSKCITVTTIATQCSIIISAGLDDIKCSSYNADCTANADGSACQEQKATCAGYITQSSCTISKASGTAAKCVWNAGACFSVTTVNIQCAYVTGNGLDDTKCAAYNVGCTSLKDGTGCQEKKAICKDYTTSNQCVSQTDGISCFWFENSCNSITAISCNSIVESTLDHIKCQAYNTSCTVNSLGTACQDLQSTCEEYQGTALNCTRTLSSKCYLYNGNTCITIQNVQNDCAKITGNAGTITFDLCQSYNNGCSVNRTKSACVQIQDQCSDYPNAMTNCYRSKAGLCISSTNTDTACISASSASNCYQLFLGSGNYNDINCNEFKSGCTVEGITSCTPRTCGNATGFTFNHINCNNWLQTCTVDNSNSKCVNISLKCKDQTKESCLLSMEGQCVVFGDVCVKKTCETANLDSNFDTDSECSSYLQQCTVARIGGCQTRSSCQSYKSSIQCKFNYAGKKCFWNVTMKLCVDLRCQLIEQTKLYDTHAECVAVDASLACTVRANKGEALAGCMSRGACSTYTIEDQCKTNATGGACVWNTNTATAVCQDKSCTSAPISITTHNDCYAYYTTATVKCTVVATPSNSGGNPTLGGCQQTAACSSYIDKEQCQINATGDPCGWNGTWCADKSCATAPATADYDDDTKCRAYFSNKCTVAETGQGCVDIPTTCETMTQKQCYYNKAGSPCYWTGTACITKSCDNAPDATASADDCNTYLDGCTYDVPKCRLKVCEDFALTTDAQCKNAMPTCTTNGKFCVSRKSCLEAQSEAGCVTSITGEICQWISNALDNQNEIITSEHCTIKTCNTAPITFTSEQQCDQYLKNCTTKYGGGCIMKSTCNEASVKEACTTNQDVKPCTWDSSLDQCRDQDCQDFRGTKHIICNNQKPTCTVGEHGRCARIQECEQTKIRAACVKGTNGPCLWIDEYINSNGSKGACFKYTSCQSLAWITDDQCKLISNLCTTDGSKCVPITQCSETNTNGGCVTGSDGICIQTLPALNSLESKICKPFTSCSDAFYITHQECQMANKQCTTDGKTGCIPLSSCQSYLSQIGCQIDNIGVVIQSGNIQSTGICIWDEKVNLCRDQSCSEFTGTSHKQCNQFLSKCTSDGTACLQMDLCSSYTTQSICKTAIGFDGICFWESASTKNNNRAQCKKFYCTDIQQGRTTRVCQAASQACISNGIFCIPKDNCTAYTTKTACNSGGLDGICVFTQSTGLKAILGIGTCSSMTSCSQANNDQNACQAAKDKCSWKSQQKYYNSVIPSRCSFHTCATYLETNGKCTTLYDWDNTFQSACITNSQSCQQIEPNQLSQNDCFFLSGFTFTWSNQTKSCNECNPKKIPNNETNTSTYKSKLIVIITLYLIF